MSLALKVALTVLTKLPRCLREAIMPDMRIPTITNDLSKVQLSRIAHVYFEHPDLDKFDIFADDFGFVKEAQVGDTIYYRGYGIDPFVYVATKSKDGKQRFLGPAFVAASEEEFEKAAALEGAERVSLEHAPGGGKMIKFSRQDNTFFHVVYGQEERKIDSEEPTATHEQQGPYNKPFTKPRRGGFNIHHLCTASCILTLDRKIPAIPPWPSTCSQARPFRLRCPGL